jgi:hypothetical protein
MTQWHADVDMPLGSGAKVTVQSQHHVVRIVKADTLSIQTPDGQRFSAVVLERAPDDLRLILDNGQAFSMRMLLDDSLHPPREPPEVFSRQIWLTH